MTLEDHAKNVIYQQSIQISALSVALDAAKKELQDLRPKQKPPVPTPPDAPKGEDNPVE